MADSLQLPYPYEVTNPIFLDPRMGPWTSVAAACAGVPIALRLAYLTVIVTGVGEYWWLPGNLGNDGLVAKTYAEGAAVNIRVITPAQPDPPFALGEVGTYTLSGTEGFYRYLAPTGGTYAPPTGTADANWEQTAPPAKATALSQPLTLDGTQRTLSFAAAYPGSADPFVAGRRHPVTGLWNGAAATTVWLEARDGRTFDTVGTALVAGVQTRVDVDVAAGTFSPAAVDMFAVPLAVRNAVPVADFNAYNEMTSAAPAGTLAGHTFDYQGYDYYIKPAGSTGLLTWHRNRKTGGGGSALTSAQLLSLLRTAVQAAGITTMDALGSYLFTAPTAGSRTTYDNSYAALTY